MRKENVKKIGFANEFFGCDRWHFLPIIAMSLEKLSWSDIGIGSNIGPYAYDDGYYSTIDEYQYNDKEPIGVHLVLELSQPVVGGRQWDDMTSTLFLRFA
ncbi:hypothetical protein P4S72_20055 [Vibrio sp. PP-XX7]